jgi:hypothetical protein
MKGQIDLRLLISRAAVVSNSQPSRPARATYLEFQIPQVTS